MEKPEGIKNNSNQKKWYNNKLLSNLLLIVFFPVGIYAIWKSSAIAKWWKITATGIVVLVVGISFGPYDSAEYREPTYNPAIQSNLGLKQHQLVIKNCQVNYWIKNSNKEKWIIFLHGAGADHRMFLEQVKVLENSYNILLIDGRGQGKSKMIDKNQSVVFSDMIDDVIQIMNITHINQTTIIAHSRLAHH